MSRVELRSSNCSVERLPSLSANLSISLKVAWPLEVQNFWSHIFLMFFYKNLKGIVAVDPVEVADGYGWKVNFGFETHIRARYNRPFPKVNQNLEIKSSQCFEHSLISIIERLILTLLIFIRLQLCYFLPVWQTNEKHNLKSIFPCQTIVLLQWWYNGHTVRMYWILHPPSSR